ncbi:hypothetical protein AAFF_G00179790 [Aldrovandia affinis]|uniref:Rho GTPase-activating protein 7 n=1 Tax=Aldrovandia affinis TaxID=143900 RepID=A0AAD7SY50_9TELE|nr:hypothetical protein AAFF_G00179790 [Aldrovandia affinis]
MASPRCDTEAHPHFHVVDFQPIPGENRTSASNVNMVSDVQSSKAVDCENVQGKYDNAICPIVGISHSEAADGQSLQEKYDDDGDVLSNINMTVEVTRPDVFHSQTTQEEGKDVTMKLDMIQEAPEVSAAPDGHGSETPTADTAVEALGCEEVGCLSRLKRCRDDAPETEGPSSDAADGQTALEGITRGTLKKRTLSEASAGKGVSGNVIPEKRGDAPSVTVALDETPGVRVSDEKHWGCTSDIAIGGEPQSAPDEDKDTAVGRRAKPHDHMDEDGAARPRMRKGRRGERERSRLDSMLLLLMKLDQLDQDIEDALNASPPASSTPPLSREEISEMDLETADREEDTLLSEQKPLPGLCYPVLVPPGLPITPGPKPKTTAMPAISEKERAEIEAKEACDWLRAAGFPQYAQLYEDSCFPINISSVTRDHDFLDHDAIDALCRRLNTLNKCAVMRLEISPQRKRSEDSDEDEPCAISSRWAFQRDSRRWSRLDEPDVFSPPGPPGSLPTESALGELSERPEVGSLHSTSSQGAGTTRTSSVTSDCSSGTSAANDDSLSEGPPSPAERFVFEARPGGKSARSKAKSFLKRMESLRLRGSAKRKRAGPAAGPLSRLEISGPVPREGLDEDKLRRLNCVDISALNALNERSRSLSHPCPARPGGSAGTSSSGGSSQSEASGGSAVSTPSPVARARARARSHSAHSKRGGMYLEGFDPFSLLPLPPAQPHGQCRAEEETHVEEEEEEEEEEEYGDDDEEEEGVVFFLIPEGHKLGTFPKALCNSLPRSSASRLRRASAAHLRRGSAGSVESRLSFYDNVPPPDPEEEEGGEDLEDTLRRVGGWAEGDSDSALDSASPCPSSPLQGRPGEALSSRDRDRDSTGNPLSEPEEGPAACERRDSGVSTSLTRDSRSGKQHWRGFQTSRRPGPASPLQIGCQSVVQMNLLQKFSLLTLTALLERHTPTSKHGFSWAVPKFMKRIKVRDHRDRSVFGVPLQVNVQRTGQPLPPSIQQAIRYLRNQCLDQVGLFRKSGVKSRIQALRQMNETGAEDGVSYEGQSAYDVADMLKQYFRDLPEPLLTSKLSDTFLQIYQYVPKDQRLQAARAAALLLPDENREALQTLLCLLGDVVANVAENQMTSTNLAVCLAPSLFHLNSLKRDSSSPRVMQRKQSLGKPDQRDLQENLAATHGLAHMIAECKKLFQIPEEMRRCRGSYIDQGLHPLKIEEFAEGGGPPGSRGYLREELDALLREAKDKFRGYDSCSTPEHAELAYKKVHDGSPLRLWKVTVEVPASPEEVLTRVLRERDRWDEALLEARVVETMDDRTEVYQYLQSSMAPHPARDHVVLRTWVSDLPKGACALVSTSVDHSGAGSMGVRANVLTSRYFIEPCGSTKSRVTHISRIDCRGRFPEWYNKTFGHVCAAEVVRIRDSFTSHIDK